MDLLTIAIALALVVAFWVAVAVLLVGPDGLVKELRYMFGGGR